MAGSIAGELVRFIDRLRWCDLPERVREQARYCVLDFLGVCLGGGTALSSEILGSHVQRSAPGRSTAIGRPFLTSAYHAALLNGTAAGALEMDDGHLRAHLHPGSCIIPALLAVAEEESHDGERLLTALVAGYETLIRLGEAVSRKALYERGFNITALLGTFGVIASLSSLCGLSPSQAKNALGLGVLTPLGSNESAWSGAMVKDLYSGWPALVGIWATQLARAGMTGPDLVFEGKRGVFANVHGGPEMPEVDLGDLGQRWRILEIYRKKYAACSLIHTAIDALLGAVRGRAVDHAGIDRIVVRTHEFADQFNECSPCSPEAVRFSTPYCLAIALIKGDVAARHLSRETLEDQRIADLARKVVVIRDQEFDSIHREDESRRPTQVDVVERSGRMLSCFREFAAGWPQLPLTPEEIIGKFSDLAVPPLTAMAAESVAQHVSRLEKPGELSQMMHILGLRMELN